MDVPGQLLMVLLVLGIKQMDVQMQYLTEQNLCAEQLWMADARALLSAMEDIVMAGCMVLEIIMPVWEPLYLMEDIAREEVVQMLYTPEQVVVKVTIVAMLLGVLIEHNYNILKNIPEETSGMFFADPKFLLARSAFQI